MKSLLVCLFFLLSFSAPLEAQWYFWGEKWCWGCRRYMDPTYAGYEALPYGYVDNINYPERYNLPINWQFNYCPPCSRQNYNFRYLINCCRANNEG